MNRITLYLPDYLLEWVEERAESRGESPSRMVARLIARDMGGMFNHHWQAWKARGSPPPSEQVLEDTPSDPD